MSHWGACCSCGDTAKIEDLKAKIVALESALKEAREAGYRAAVDKMESLVAEFGDDPKACLGILGEYFNGCENVEY
jgi:hypothetical protein